MTLPRRRKPRSNLEAALRSLGDEIGLEFAISNLLGSGVRLNARVVLTPCADDPIDIMPATRAVTPAVKKPGKRTSRTGNGRPPTP